jgi:hypothetical protein
MPTGDSPAVRFRDGPFGGTGRGGGAPGGAGAAGPPPPPPPPLPHAAVSARKAQLVPDEVDPLLEAVFVQRRVAV